MRAWETFNRWVTVEPIAFLYFFNVCVTTTAWQALLYRKFCVQANNSLSNCLNIKWQQTQPQLQAQTSQWMIYSNTVTIVPMLFTITMLSGYSGRHGVRLALFLPYVLGVISTGWVIVNILFLHWHPILLLVSSFLTGVSGFYAVVTMATTAYVVHDSDPNDYAVRIAALQAVVSIAYMVGSFVVGPILDSGVFGLASCFIMMVVCNVAGVLDIALRLRSCGYPPVKPKDSFCEAFCSLRSIREYVTVITRPRVDYRRLHIQLITIIFMFGFCAITGVMDIAYLYMTKTNGYSNTINSIWAGMTCIVTTLGNTVGMQIFTKKFNIGAHAILILGVASNALSYGAMIYFKHKITIWLSLVLRPFISYISIGSYMYIAQCLDSDEQSAGLGYLAMVQALFALLASIMFNGLYPVTLSFWPGFCFALAAGLCVLTGPIIIFIKWHDNRIMDSRIKSDSPFVH